eukprot:TRINITY_DN19068_c0_g1_i1.p1 TRINITY_DN19068_c0_g1~~TRINITY_DN19068_c0_g1_i1.p1  ORF type:complete len:185 (-),score=41.28 TRINITY_DN19068_c0_g1_i1:58-612(-)
MCIRDSPNTDPATIKIDNEKAFQWVMNGAQPTDTVKAMLSYRGVLLRKHLQIGVIKGAVTQEEADKKYQAWLDGKESQITGKVEQLAKAKDDAKKAKLEAEAKVNTARAEAIAARKAEAEAANAPAVEEAPEEEAAPEASAVSYTHLRAHETVLDLVCRLLLEKKKKNKKKNKSTYMKRQNINM